MAIKKNKQKVFFHTIGIYKTGLVLMIGGTPADVFEWMKKELLGSKQEEVKAFVKQHERDIEDKGEHFTTQATTWPISGGGSIIWMRTYEDNVLVHEIVHAVHHMLLSKGIQLSNETTEAHAYLTEYLYKQLRAPLILRLRRKKR